jgi:hypothetical protein
MSNLKPFNLKSNSFDYFGLDVTTIQFPESINSKIENNKLDSDFLNYNYLRFVDYGFSVQYDREKLFVFGIEIYSEIYPGFPFYKTCTMELPSGVLMLMKKEQVIEILGHPSSSSFIEEEHYCSSPIVNFQERIFTKYCDDFYNFGDCNFRLKYNQAGRLVWMKISSDSSKIEINESLNITYPNLVEDKKAAFNWRQVFARWKRGL